MGVKGHAGAKQENRRNAAELAGLIFVTHWRALAQVEIWVNVDPA